jgi:hypothetical protein
MHAPLDMWTIIAQRQRKLNAIQKMCKVKLTKTRTLTALFVAYYTISNAILKTVLKTKIRTEALLWRRRRKYKKHFVGFGAEALSTHLFSPLILLCFSVFYLRRKSNQVGNGGPAGMRYSGGEFNLFFCNFTDFSN